MKTLERSIFSFFYTLEKYYDKKKSRSEIIKWLRPEENDFYTVDYFKKDGVDTVKIKKLDKRGKIISTFEQRLVSFTKLRFMTILHPEIIWTLVNLHGNCPEFIIRMLGEMRQDYNKMEKEKV